MVNSTKPNDLFWPHYYKGYCPAERAFSVVIAWLTFRGWVQFTEVVRGYDLRQPVRRSLMTKAVFSANFESISPLDYAVHSISYS